MTDVALVAATLLADDVDPWGMPVLRAVLPVAGMTVIEQQAEQLRSCGITRMLVHVDAVPAALAHACERIRGRGVDCRLVRTPADVSEQSVAASRILLVADGLIADAPLWRMAYLARETAVLVTADGPMTSSLERIDANTRWAGLAVVDRSLIGGLDGVADDWDPQLVLFRNALQNGAMLIDCDQSLFVSGDVTVAETPAEAAGAEQRLMASGAADEWGVFGRWVIAPLVNVAGPALLARQNSGKLLRLTTVTLAIGTAAAAVLQQPWLMAAGGLCAAFSHQAARFLNGFRPESGVWPAMAIAGIISQFVALGLADRAVIMGGSATLVGSGFFAAIGGSGGMTVSIVLLLSLILQRKLSLPAGRLVDFPTVWLASALLVPVTGWRQAFDLIGMASAALLVIVLLRSASRRSDTFQGAV